MKNIEVRIGFTFDEWYAAQKEMRRRRRKLFGDNEVKKWKKKDYLRLWKNMISEVADHETQE